MSTFQRENFSNRVAEHYNHVEQKSIKDRKRSDIIDLRKFNNAMKSLMHYQAFKFVKPSLEPRVLIRVLDLGCGKGGDLPKYSRNNLVGMVVGVDIADVSIEQCKARFKTMGHRLKGEFFVADLTREDIKKKLVEINCTERFHVASSQFSLHYSFESFDQAVRYINNAAHNLLRLGIFIGTYPDGPKLLKLARQSETPGTFEVEDILRIQFSPEDLRNPKPFGTKYHFRLKEVVDCPEFLVHPQVLEELMTSLGFIKVFDRSFEEQINVMMNGSDRDAFINIFEKHEALDFDPIEKKASLAKNMWQAASIYRCFCYRKARD